MMRLGSLCTGIGGLDLGLALALAALGFRSTIAWQVEHNAYCQEVLAQRFPGADRTVSDVRNAGGHNLAPVDGIAAGFPCQPVSYSGRRRARADARWLWPAIERVVRELGPGFVFLENVPGLLTADNGHAFAEVLGDLAALGFDAEWNCVRADVVGSPQKRARVFLLAYRDGVLGAGAALADPDARVQQRGPAERVRGRALSSGALGRGEGSRRRSAALSGLGRNAHGAPGGLDRPRWPAGRGELQHPWEPPRTKAKVPFRPERLRALGNAVVPAQAAYAFQMLWARRAAR